jgi:hypothetical protein
MSAIIGTAMVGAFCAVALILMFMVVGKIYDLYVGIFSANGRARWASWNIIQRLLWILFLPILVIVIPVMVGFQVLFIISLIYLGLSLARGIVRAIS